MADYLEESINHYDRTVGLHKGHVVQIDGIVYDSNLTKIPRRELHRYMSYEDSHQLMQARIRKKGKLQQNHILLSDIEFPFPESKLINVVDKSHAKAVFINRYAYRQWRRGLRMSMLTKILPNSWLAKSLGLNTLMGNKLSWRELEEFFFPTYYDPLEVLDLVKQRAGTYAISPSFWVGVGKLGLVFGYQQYVVGTIEDTQYMLHENAQDLYEQLVEIVGERHASIRGDWIP